MEPVAGQSGAELVRVILISRPGEVLKIDRAGVTVETGGFPRISVRLLAVGSTVSSLTPEGKGWRLKFALVRRRGRLYIEFGRIWGPRKERWPLTPLPHLPGRTRLGRLTCSAQARTVYGVPMGVGPERPGLHWIDGLPGGVLIHVPDDPIPQSLLEGIRDVARGWTELAASALGPA